MADPTGPRMTPTGYAASAVWNGNRNPGEQFTEEQKHEMRRLRPGRKWDVRMVKTKRPRELTQSEIMFGKPAAEAFDIVEVACPLLNRGLEYDTVITPGGDVRRLPTTNRRGRMKR